MRLRLGFLSRYRPRALTVVMLLFVAALIALSNLSFDTGEYSQGAVNPSGTYVYRSYGWPVVWHRYILYETYNNASSRTVSWHYGGARLAANLSLWLCMLIAAAAASEWLQRCYPPRLRFSLRGMLAAVALIAVFCAWFVVARQRADVQEPLIAEITARDGSVMFERWGPQWLDLFGIDPLRRRIIGLEFKTYFGISEEEDAAEEAFLERIGRVSDLQYLFVETNQATPGLAEALGEMRQLRALSLDASDNSERGKRSLDACLSAIAQMHELEHLYLMNASIHGERLAALEGLTKLKWLSLQFCDEPTDEATLFERLPVLPRLETFEALGLDISDRDLPRLAALPRLKALNLESTKVTAAGLAKLAALDSLEELKIESQWATPAGLASLKALKHLKKLHVDKYYWGSAKEDESAPGKDAGGSHGPFRGSSVKSVWVRLDHGGEAPANGSPEAFVSVPEAERDARLKAIQTLRRTLPGLAIDSDHSAIHSFNSKYELWYAHDTTIGRRAAWLPLSEYPWGGPAGTPRATRADCEAYAAKLGVPISF